MVSQYAALCALRRHSRTLAQAIDSSPHTSDVDDDRPPICTACGVTMVPAALSAREEHVGDWICLECEETADPNAD